MGGGWGLGAGWGLDEGRGPHSFSFTLTHSLTKTSLTAHSPTASQPQPRSEVAESVLSFLPSIHPVGDTRVTLW